jgi:hypothetical protein
LEKLILNFTQEQYFLQVLKGDKTSGFHIKLPLNLGLNFSLPKSVGGNKDKTILKTAFKTHTRKNWKKY